MSEARSEDVEPILQPEMARLAGVMHRLRSPGGCAWDAAQTELSLKTHLVEETYELVAAIDADDPEEIREELGDVLLQVVFQAEIASQRGRFTLDDVARGIAEKLIRRHPHVFGEQRAESASAALASWETVKRAERSKGGATAKSILDGVPAEMPALLAALRISGKAAGVGFDWPELGALWEKVDEELRELREAVAAEDREHILEEMGDLLFILANLARKLELDPEDALRLANSKFKRRFRFIEKRLHDQGRTPEESDLAEMDRYWDEAKAGE